MEVLALLGHPASVRVAGVNGMRTLLDIDGVPGWVWTNNRQHVGLAVRISIEAPGDAWLRQASLLLAASNQAVDQCLLLEGSEAWLYSWFTTAMNAVEWESSLHVVLTVAKILADQKLGKDIAREAKPGRCLA